MNQFTRLIAAVACAAPLLAVAQTTTPTAPTSPSMDSAPSPNIKPADPATSGKNVGNEPTSSSMSRSTKSKTAADKSKDAAPTGSLSTYPAPTVDGKPTSPSTTK